MSKTVKIAITEDVVRALPPGFAASVFSVGSTPVIVPSPQGQAVFVKPEDVDTWVQAGAIRA